MEDIHDADSITVKEECVEDYSETARAEKMMEEEEDLPIEVFDGLQNIEEPSNKQLQDSRQHLQDSTQQLQDSQQRSSDNSNPTNEYYTIYKIVGKRYGYKKSTQKMNRPIPADGNETVQYVSQLDPGIPAISGSSGNPTAGSSCPNEWTKLSQNIWDSYKQKQMQLRTSPIVSDVPYIPEISIPETPLNQDTMPASLNQDTMPASLNQDIISTPLSQDTITANRVEKKSNSEKRAIFQLKIARNEIKCLKSQVERMHKKIDKLEMKKSEEIKVGSQEHYELCLSYVRHKVPGTKYRLIKHVVDNLTSYSEEVKDFGVKIYQMSPSAYKFVKDYWHLPTENTMKEYCKLCKYQ